MVKKLKAIFECKTCGEIFRSVGKQNRHLQENPEHEMIVHWQFD